MVLFLSINLKKLKFKQLSENFYVNFFQNFLGLNIINEEKLILLCYLRVLWNFR